MNKVFRKKTPLNPERCSILYCRTEPGIDKVSELYPEDNLRNPVLTVSQTDDV